jgi:hypothetical protein
MNRRHVAQFNAGPGNQTVLNVNDHFTLDNKVMIESKRILREVDHPLDRVFNWYKTRIDGATLHGVKNVWHRPKGHLFS